MNESKNVKQYRGFSVIPPVTKDGTIKYCWSSTSLNANLMIPCLNQLPRVYREKVKTQIETTFKSNSDISVSDIRLFKTKAAYKKAAQKTRAEVIFHYKASK